MKVILSCSVQGDAFRPTEAECESGLRFVDKNEVGELGTCGRYAALPQPYGFGRIEREASSNELETPLLDFLDCVTLGSPIWRKYGAEDVSIQIDVFYENQCNLEFSESVIKRFHQLGLAVGISCYRVTSEEPVDR